MNDFSMHHFTLFSAPPEITKSSLALRRNVAGWNFCPTLDNQQKRELRDRILEAVENTGEFDAGQHYFPDTDERKVLGDVFFETGIIKSSNWNRKPQGRAVLHSPDFSLHLAINDEDHIRLFADSSIDLTESWQKLSALDDKIESKLGYSFEPQFGYLTTRPRHCGTALEAMYVLHLPLASQNPVMREEVEEIKRKYELSINTAFGCPAFVRVENERCFGLSEEDIIWRTELGVHQIAEVERCARDVYIGQHREKLEDMVGKALAVTGCAKLIACDEAEEILSTLRLGTLAGIDGCPSTKKIDTFSGMTATASVKLQLLAECALSAPVLNREADRLRAHLLREMLEADSD